MRRYERFRPWVSRRPCFDGDLELASEERSTNMSDEAKSEGRNPSRNRRLATSAAQKKFDYVSFAMPEHSQPIAADARQERAALVFIKKKWKFIIN